MMRSCVVTLLVLALSCREAPTEVLVRLATDVPDIDSLVISIYDDEDEPGREQPISR